VFTGGRRFKSGRIQTLEKPSLLLGWFFASLSRLTDNPCRSPVQIRQDPPFRKTIPALGWFFMRQNRVFIAGRRFKSRRIQTLEKPSLLLGWFFGSLSRLTDNLCWSPVQIRQDSLFRETIPFWGGFLVYQP
jgi:hypothetical protein